MEIIDGVQGTHGGTVPGCAEASGVLYAPEPEWVFAAARGSGQILLWSRAGKHSGTDGTTA